VDDEEKVVEVLSAYLLQNGYDVRAAYNGKDAVRIFESGDVSLVILDLMLPDMTGEEICIELRARSRVPIIMLTAKVGEASFLNRLDIGADDYITKPFSPRGVIAKVKAVLRRAEGDELTCRPISYGGGLTIDFHGHAVKLSGVEISLTPMEYKLLHAMAKAPDRAFTHDQLIHYALGDDFDGFDRSIDTYIKGLRAKIEPDRKNPRYIQTVHGLGYKFTAVGNTALE
jgi:DNA-binding response OmpR family regulator